MRIAVHNVFLLAVAFLMMISLGRAENRDGASRVTNARAEGLIIARCSVCHSPDLIRQQRVDRSHWAATVEKMRHWGAELADEEATLLTDYLSARYHQGAPDDLAEEVPDGVPLRAEEETTGGRPSGVARRGDGIFAQNCQACHGAKGTGGAGPTLSRNPILMDEERFWETVEQGRGAMPAWKAALAPQEIADVWEWLKEQ